MKALGMSVESDGKPTDEQHQNHVKKLWLIFKSFVNGRNGSQYLSQIPNGDPFHNWSHHNRYARGCHFQRADVEPHRKAACTVYYMVQRAEQDGYFVSFDAMQQRVTDMLKSEAIPDETTSIYLARDLFGRVRILVSDAVQEDSTLQRLAAGLHKTLGKHGYPAEEAVLFVDDAMLKALNDMAQEILPGVYWVDRLVTSRDWWTVGDSDPQRTPMRYTLFSVKGGVGRSTTAAVLA